MKNNKTGNILITRDVVWTKGKENEKKHHGDDEASLEDDPEEENQEEIDTNMGANNMTVQVP